MPAVHTSNAAGGTPGSRTFRYKSRLTGTLTEFYAERGMISVHEEHPDGRENYRRVGLRDFLARADAMNRTVKILRGMAACAGSEGQRRRHHQEAVDHMRLVEVMVAVAQAAKHQGDPLDRNVRKTNPRTVVGFSGAARPRPFCTGMSPMPKAPPGAQVKEVGGKVLDMSKVIILPGR